MPFKSTFPRWKMIFCRCWIHCLNLPIWKFAFFGIQAGLYNFIDSGRDTRDLWVNWNEISFFFFLSSFHVSHLSACNIENVKCCVQTRKWSSLNLAGCQFWSLSFIFCSQADAKCIALFLFGWHQCSRPMDSVDWTFLDFHMLWPNLHSGEISITFFYCLL